MIRLLESIPAALTRIDQPPRTLYFDGNPALLDAPLVAVVGTRRPSAYTKTWVQKIASALSQSGAVVVSGGALGVDAIAHEAAFPNTVAVLAGSIETGFVRSNQNLIQRMRNEGLVLSEYESGVEPKPWSFVHRNRLVTGLAQAVIVAEADENSGSMTSARFAIKQQKPLYALPHRLGESAGTQNLLSAKQAQAVWSVEALITGLGLKAVKKGDDLMDYFQSRPLYEEAIGRFGAAVYEYELSGRITVRDGRVEVCRGALGD